MTERRDLAGTEHELHFPLAIRRQAEARAVLPHKRERRGGLLATISSSSGLPPSPGGSTHSLSKFALEGWIEGLAQEVEPFGIRSLIVEPGMMRTDLLDLRSARLGDLEIAKRRTASQEHAGPNRVGLPGLQRTKTLGRGNLPSPFAPATSSRRHGKLIAGQLDTAIKSPGRDQRMSTHEACGTQNRACDRLPKEFTMPRPALPRTDSDKQALSQPMNDAVLVKSWITGSSAATTGLMTRCPMTSSRPGNAWKPTTPRASWSRTTRGMSRGTRLATS